MNLSILQHKAGQFLSENASTIFTGVGVVGVVATAVLAAKATVEAKEKLEKSEKDWKEASMEYDLEHDGHGMLPPLTRMQKAVSVAPYFIPPVAAGGITIASIVMSNRVSAKRAAALAAAYGISENRFKEYRAKVQEKLTGPKSQAIDDEIAQDRVNGNPPPTNLVVIEGEVLCYDKLTGRYFHSSVERLRQAEHAINHELHLTAYASLSEFYDRIGLEKTTFTDLVGWNTLGDEAPVKLELSTTMSPDGRPCIVVDFNYIPRPDAHKLY